MWPWKEKSEPAAGSSQPVVGRQRLVVPRHQTEIDRVGFYIAAFFELCPCRPKQCQMLAVMVAPRCMFRVYIEF